MNATTMQVRDALKVLMDNPNWDTLDRQLAVIGAICEQQYVEGKEMQKKLLRIQLGLATKGDC